MTSVQQAPQSDQAYFDNAAMRALAKERGISQRELAKRLMVDKGTVIRWAHAHVEPSPRLLLEMAEVLGVPPEELYKPGSAGRDLAYYRVLSGHSMNSLAAALKISNSLLRSIESGRRDPSSPLHDCLRSLLGIDESTMQEAMGRRQPRAPRPRRKQRVDVAPAVVALPDVAPEIVVDAELSRQIWRVKGLRASR